MKRCEYCGEEFDGSDEETVCEACSDAIQNQLAEEYAREVSRQMWNRFLEQEQRDWEDYVERHRRWVREQDVLSNTRDIRTKSII